jgi:outer membrane receptor protein involved in Fe transport
MSDSEKRAQNTVESESRRKRPFGAVSLLALAAGLLPVAAGAQTAAPTTSDSSGDEVIVTGSRISGFTAPTPVTTLGAEQLEAKAAGTVADLLDDVPQLRVNQNIGKSSEPVGGSNADLRSLSTQRTLVLVDGRRVALTDPQGTIDTNIIPIALISSIEVVTGGASAAYGSDAVAGVVNFLLDKKFDGFKADVAYGQSKYHDHIRPTASFAAGTGLMDDRMHLTIAGDYMHNSGQTAQGQRSWGANETVLLPVPGWNAATSTGPRQILANNARFVQQTPGGVVGTSTVSPAGVSGARISGTQLGQRLGFGAGRGVQFDVNGNPIPFVYGTNIGATYMVGGDGGSTEDAGNILPEIERVTGYGRASFDLTNNISVFADLMFAQVDVDSDLGPNPDNGAITIRNDNYYLSQTLKTAMAAAGATNFAFGRTNYEDGNSNSVNTTTVRRWTFGVEGSFWESWKWDLTGAISRNKYDSDARNNRIDVRWTNGLDAVNNPATGQAICRVKLNNPNANDATDPFRDIRDCVPINAFGAGKVSQAALDYYHGTSFTRARQSQDVYAANISGEPFSTWAGPVSIATGAEYREEETVQESDTSSALSRWRSINAQPFSGKYDVKEGYVEVAVPLARDMAFADNIDVNAAARYTDYSTSGGIWAWKLGANYSPVADLRFRATVSRDIRAPNNFELYSRGNQVLQPVTDPRDNISRTAKQLTSGNPFLTPEEADTTTVGVVYRPHWFPGLEASVDYYKIDVEGAISNVAQQDVVDSCFKLGLQNFCSGIILDPATGFITQVNTSPYNADNLETSGYDIEAKYKVALGQGEMTVRGLANYVNELTTTRNGIANDFAGLVGLPAPPIGAPKWRYNIDASYAIGRWGVGASFNYIGGGEWDTRWNKTQNDIADNTIAGRGYVDINAKYDVTKEFQIYGAVQNLFDQDPPIVPNAINQPTIANSQFYDKRGQYIVVGGRVRLK